MNLLHLGQVADQYHRFRVEVVGNNIEVSVIVEIKHHRRTGRQGAQNIDRSRSASRAGFHSLPTRSLRAVDGKPVSMGAVIPARFNPKNELSIQKALSAII